MSVAVVKFAPAERKENLSTMCHSQNIKFFTRFERNAVILLGVSAKAKRQERKFA
jgi:hypothetical protein